MQWIDSLYHQCALFLSQHLLSDTLLHTDTCHLQKQLGLKCTIACPSDIDIWLAVGSRGRRHRVIRCGFHVEAYDGLVNVPDVWHKKRNFEKGLDFMLMLVTWRMIL